MVNRMKPVDDLVIWISREDLKTTVTKKLKDIQEKKGCNIENMGYLRKHMRTLKKK